MWCWWCCHPFDGDPLSMPYRYDNKRNKFFTTGNFCSWSCMKSFAVDKHGDTRGSIICGNIIVMRKQLFGKIGSIKPAPNRFKLNVFGGDLTIDEFRSNTVRDSDVQPKDIDSEEVTSILIPIQQSTKKLSDIQNSTRSNDVLRLKRNKPLKQNQNNLESALGLIIK